jgi:hypothetical protein
MSKSKTIELYASNRECCTPEQITFADEVYALCETNYNKGGDTVVECFTPAEICQQFKTLNDVREYCGLRLEAAANARWGDDTDRELLALDRHKEWKG